MKLTRPGLYYLFLVAAITLSATYTKTNLLYLFNAFLIALIVLSWGLARNNAKKISVRMESPLEIFCGTPFPIRYLISNQASSSKFALRFEDPVTGQRFDLVEVPARNTVSICCETEFKIRGVRQWKYIPMTSEFPFGFFECRGQISMQQEIVVLPRPRNYTAIELPTKSGMFREGNFTAITRTASQDFASLRDYQAGDHLKRIHWKASAKTDGLIVKEYEEDLPAGVSIVMDIWPEPYEADHIHDLFETAIELTASLIWEIAHAGYLILFAHGEHFISYGRGREHALSILRVLAYLDLNKSMGDRSAVENAIEKIPGSSTAIFVFLRLREEIAQYLCQLSQIGCQVAGISVKADTLTMRPPSVELYHFQGIERDNIILEVRR